MRLFIVFLIIIFTKVLFASEHGIYLHTVSDIKLPVSEVRIKMQQVILHSGFTLLYDGEVKTPDYVREDSSEYCGYKAHLFVLSSDDYLKMITEVGNKYLVAGLLKIGIYETPAGAQISIANPETINRIIFNDLEED